MRYACAFTTADQDRRNFQVEIRQADLAITRKRIEPHSGQTRFPNEFFRFDGIADGQPEQRAGGGAYQLGIRDARRIPEQNRPGGAECLCGADGGARITWVLNAVDSMNQTG